jgi:hypothetical protein
MTMRVMVIVKATEQGEAGALPSEAHLAAMGKYNEELQKAGVLLDLSGLRPSSAGVRVRFARGKRTVLDGPFTETKELIGGFWILRVESRDEAIEWAKRIPAEICEIGEVELRPFYELEDIFSGAALDAARELERKLPGNDGSKR